MRWKAWLFASSLIVPIAAAPRVASAQRAPDAATRNRARENFRAGVAAYQRGDYSVALEAFLTAYRAAPHPTVRVNVANCYMQLHQPVEAITWFEAFLAESPNAPPEQRDEVQRQLAELRGQIAEVHVGLSPDSVRDAIVSIDGHPASIQNHIRLSPGRHVIEATAEGYQPERSDVNVTAGQRTDVVLRMRSTAPAAVNAVATTTPPPASTTSTGAAGVSPTTTATPEPATTAAPVQTAPAATTTQASEASTAPATDVVDTRPHDNHTLSPAFFYSGVALTGAALVSFASFGIAALVNNGTYESARNNIQNGTYTDLTAEQDRGYNALVNTNTFKVVADVSLGVTVVAAAATIFLFTRTRFGDRPSVAIAPMGGPGTGGVVLGGTF